VHLGLEPQHVRCGWVQCVPSKYFGRAVHQAGARVLVVSRIARSLSGGSYYYVVTSVDSDNVESMYSNEVSAALRRVGAEAGEPAIGKFWSRAFPVLFSRKKTGGGLLGGPLVFQTDAALAPSGGSSGH
jgi:hypothetical protein